MRQHEAGALDTRCIGGAAGRQEAETEHQDPFHFILHLIFNHSVFQFVPSDRQVLRKALMRQDR